MITVEALIRRVRELAREKPDFIYPKNVTSEGPSCVYNAHEDGRPPCIFGQAFIDLGEPVDEPSGEAAGAIWSVCHVKGIAHTQRQRYWMVEMQSAQDCKIPWGEAMRQADTWLAERVLFNNNLL